MTKTFSNEQEYLQHYNIHDYDVPLVSVDIALFTLLDEQLQVLLVKRADYPHKNRWSLPGGFINPQQDTDLLATARRKLMEKTGVEITHLEQVETIGHSKRDPRGWSITVLYMALIPHSPAKAIIDTVSDSRWWPLDSALKQRLAFDHKQLITQAQDRLRTKTGYTVLPAYIIDAPFTLTQLQQAFEQLLGKNLEKKSFRRRILAADVLEEAGAALPQGGRGRKAIWYRPRQGSEQHAFLRVFGLADDL